MPFRFTWCLRLRFFNTHKSPEAMPVSQKKNHSCQIAVALLLTPRDLCRDALWSLADISHSIPTYCRHAGTTVSAVTRLTGQGCVCRWSRWRMGEPCLPLVAFQMTWSMRGTTLPDVTSGLQRKFPRCCAAFSGATRDNNQFSTLRR